MNDSLPTVPADIEAGFCVADPCRPSLIYCVVEKEGNIGMLRNCATRQLRRRRLDRFIVVTPPEHGTPSKLKIKQWEALVFANASYFRVVRKVGVAKYDSKEFPTFPQAIKEARESKGIVYAVAASGRYFAIGASEYDRWQAIWDSYADKGEVT